MKEEKQTRILGISSTAVNKKVGSLIVAMIVVKPTFFREHARLKIRRNNLTIQEISHITKMTIKHVVYHNIVSIAPAQLAKSSADNLQVKAIIELLNQKHRFWRDKISIADLGILNFTEKFFEFLPINLKKLVLDINKWLSNIKTAPIALANIYARYYSELELADVRNIWGDFGSGEKDDLKTKEFIKNNPECPYIRKNEEGIGGE